MGRLPEGGVGFMIIDDLTTNDRAKPRTVNIDDSDINWEGKIVEKEVRRQL